MPSCAYPPCTRSVPAEGDYCADHASVGQQSGAASQRFYDQHRRDPAAKQFYNSKAWKDARAKCLANHPVCERCIKLDADSKAFAVHVHHIKPLKQCSDEEKTAQSNLQALCVPCHNTVESELTDSNANALPFVSGMLRPVEDGRFYFDGEAADKAVAFIERECRHYEGQFAGKPFLLLDWQKDVVRTVFGWKHRTGPRQGMRRFRELYVISAKGAGKTPLMTGIGLYMLLADGENAAHVISMASTVEQAYLTFDAAKKYIAENPKMAADPRVRPLQHQIQAPRYSQWTTISGEPNGRSGTRPTCLIASEIHEWPAPTAKAFELVCKNMFKRPNSLILMDTNAGKDKTCYAWQLHERAVAVLSGQSDDVTLLPVIFEAPDDLDWRSEAAAAAANPSLGKIVHFDQLKPEMAKGEPEYKRLFLSKWGGSAERWLDMSEYDQCTGPVSAEAIAGAPLYVGLDLSLDDDLCAAAFVYPTATTFYVQPCFWLPKRKAELYRSKHRIPYIEWHRAGAIDLVDEPTISTAVQERIGAFIVAVHKAHPITAVCYDRKYSSNTIAVIQSAGIECRPVGQGYMVSPGTNELDRRIKERSVVIEKNPVMRFCAENAEVKTDDRGNIFPVKPHAKGRYAGYRPAKIDGITATVTAFTEARGHTFPKPQEKKQWDGMIAVVGR